MCFLVCFFFFKQKTAYEMRISDWSSDVCSSDLTVVDELATAVGADDEERRGLALVDATGELDIDLVAIVEGAHRLPGRIVAGDGIAEADVLERDVGSHR